MQMQQIRRAIICFLHAPSGTRFNSTAHQQPSTPKGSCSASATVPCRSWTDALLRWHRLLLLQLPLCWALGSSLFFNYRQLELTGEPRDQGRIQYFSTDSYLLLYSSTNIMRHEKSWSWWKGKQIVLEQTCHSMCYYQCELNLQGWVSKTCGEEPLIQCNVLGPSHVA